MSGVFDFISSFFRGAFAMPPLETYSIPEKPRRDTDPRPGTRTTAHRVYGGKIMRDTVAEDGTIETTIGDAAPRTSAEVVLDAFDVAALDAILGQKWQKNRDRAAVMKWHWLQAHSAMQIEREHTDAKTRQVERGFSERTAADYVAAFYEADNARERAGRPRLRNAASSSAAASFAGSGNTIEW
jgi:hypothetical protein